MKSQKNKKGTPARQKLSNSQKMIEGVLLLVVFFNLYLFASLITFDPADPGWSQTAWHEPIQNMGGSFGAYLGDVFLQAFGFVAYLIPFIGLMICGKLAYYFYGDVERPHYFSISLQLLGVIVFVFSLCCIFEVNINDWQQYQSGGVLGSLVSLGLVSIFNTVGTTVICLALFAMSITLLTGLSWLTISEYIGIAVMWLLSPIIYLIRHLRHGNSKDDEQDEYEMEEDQPTAPSSRSQPMIPPSFEDEKESLQAALATAQPVANTPLTQIDTGLAQPEANDYRKIEDTPYEINTDFPPSYLHLLGEQSNKTAPASYHDEDDPLFHGIRIRVPNQPENLAEPNLNIPRAEPTQPAPLTSVKMVQPETIIQPSQPKVDYDHFYFDDDAEAEITPISIHDQQVTSPYIAVGTADNDANQDDYAWHYDNEDKPANVAGMTSPSAPANPYTWQPSSDTLDELELDTLDDAFVRENAPVVSESTPTTSWQSDVRAPHTSQTSQTSQTPLTVENTVEKTPATAHQDALIHPLLMRHDQPLTKPTTPLPSLDLLTAPPATHEPVDMMALKQTADLVEKSLADFRVSAKVVGILPGPVITLYELDLAPGVKASRISALSRDLARSLSATAVRVVEVMPGKPYVGLELPNLNRQTVYFREVLDSPQFREAKSPLSIVLGKDISGESVVADLAKMPHLLVAGTTGSGKSVGVNAMIISILYKAKPEEVRFIMIDPKMLELSIYEGIPHLLTQVVTDMKDAANALNWCVNEMERRYRLMSALGVRNLAGYNEKISLAEEMGRPIPDPLWKPGDTMDETHPTLEKLPYIVVMVDEFADLIMAVGKKIEELIARLAQKARAAGIHLVLATQRPSVDVITGLIKANIPTRIAFTVSSKIDSRTILDQMGAESLLGMGDMLYLPPNSSIPVRVHGAFVRDEEVHAVVQDWKARGKPTYIENITASTDDSEGSGFGEEEDLDPLFDQVVAFVVEKQRASISSVQRQFRIGYNRAARIVEQMESAGVVSAPNHSGNREVLAPPTFQDY